MNGTSDGNSTHATTDAEPGTVGLENLGNTCYMNSVLQCLAQCHLLTDFFLKDDGQALRRDLNRVNPIGTKGALAESYADLITKLWQGGVGFVTPWGFKHTFGTFAPEFSGYDQQDSHEMLALLLDRLHEDVNRVREKQYVEEKDSEGRPDHEVAEEAWRGYTARNDSIVVDVFHGLIKNRRQCPTCACESVKFDPFMYLALPVGKRQTQTTVQIVLARMDGVEPDQMVRYLDVKVRPMNDSSRGLELELERESWTDR